MFLAGVVEALALGGGAGGGPEYKITLSRAHARPAPAAVTSTNPKTPSPSLNVSRHYKHTQYTNTLYMNGLLESRSLSGIIIGRYLTY